MKNNSWSQFLSRFSARLAVRISESMAPLMDGALTYLQDLKVYCPEAFDEAGSLRPDWEQIVRARLAAEQPVKTPQFHFELLARRKTVNLN